VLIELRDAPPREEKIAASIARDETCDRGVIASAETHDHVLHSGHTQTFKVAYRPA
jgi:hypothetical protein